MTNHGSGEILFSIEDLQGGYGDIQILNGVNIKVPEKSIVTIVGPNGAGKSTILKAIYGIANVTAGKVTLRKGLVLSMSWRLSPTTFLELVLVMYLRLKIFSPL
jgi:ABC-type branched-subunit amino acid transport system ATPase component